MIPMIRLLHENGFAQAFGGDGGMLASFIGHNMNATTHCNVGSRIKCEICVSCCIMKLWLEYYSSLDLASSAACIFQRLFWIYHLFLHKLLFLIWLKIYIYTSKWLQWAFVKNLLVTLHLPMPMMLLSTLLLIGLHTGILPGLLSKSGWQFVGWYLICLHNITVEVVSRNCPWTT